jgi:hypothetical protein
MIYDNYDIINFLNSIPDALNILKEDYKIIIKEKENYILLKYHQLDSPKCHLTNQCRGSIFVAEKPYGMYKYVCRPFYRFYNYGEEQAEEIDWESAIVQEKIDGSLVKCWYDVQKNDWWRWSTNGMIDAYECDISQINLEQNLTFGKLISQTITKHMSLKVGDVLEIINNFKDYTHLFELCTIYNKVVVHHEEPKLYYLCSIHNKTGEEIMISNIPFPTPKTYTFKSLQDCINNAKELPYNEEGYVVKDKYNNRQKVKSPAYLAIHQLKGERLIPTDKNILTLVKQGDTEEFLSYFPEYKKFVEKIQEKYDLLLHHLKIDYNMYQMMKFDTRKELALWAKEKCIYPPFIFGLKDKYFKTVDDFLNDNKMTEERMLKIMEKI